MEHYGGMWKVAYADFITAMMAFFILLWVLNSTPKENLQGLAAYFTPGILQGGKGLHKDSSKNEQDYASSGLIDEHTRDQQRLVFALNAIENHQEFRQFAGNISAQLTDEGLVISIAEDDQSPMFVPGTYRMQPHMYAVLDEIGKLVNHLPNYISVVGHTAALKAPDPNVDLWELSMHRANAVRKYMISKTIRDEQIINIVGKADREPRDIKNIYNSRNIRISIILLAQKSLSRHHLSAPKS